ncbi:potassium transporter 5 [Aristolochia californica]|uniref:potassium transporter 5 n=1 Tax=Aristolochia californica TaxID=171875 RepID=UPI0035D86148
MGHPIQAGEGRDEEIDEGTEMAAPEPPLKERKFSWAKLRRVDSLNLEAGNVSNAQSHHAKVGLGITLKLAFQCIGVIYGDIGTSPLYVFASTFTEGIHHNDDILGVLSLILYTLVLIPLVKYVFIVLWANDNGDGGTFALYSLICRYARVSLIPNHQVEDRELSNYKLDTPSTQLRRAQKIKEKLENSKKAKIVLFIITILGTSMVIGDGVLTPCISVLSAVSGIKEAADSLSQDTVVAVSVVILILLFAIQRFGTDKVGYSFAPIIILWFGFISLIGLYNLTKHDISVLRAFNPKYIIDYFRRNGKQGWISLGGVVLCITGTEAMFADLGHFSVRSVQISFCSVVLPALSCAYIGQAAYLSKNPQNVADTFYKSIPKPLYWPQFVVAVAAAIIASQAMVSGAFAIISQSLSLDCFPRVKVVHTSAKYEGQVYIPEVNYVLMIACIIVTIGFRTTEKIGNAYGIAVVAVMVITTCMVTLIMLVIWKTSIWAIGLFFVVFCAAEIIYLSSVLYKFVQGGYLPLAFSAVLMAIMGIWHYVHKKRYMFELQNKVSTDYIKDLTTNSNLRRIPGIGFLYSELVQGIPPIFSHFLTNIPSIHSVLVFVSIKSIPISKVALEERFLFRQVEPREYRMFRCVARYGYNDVREKPEEFERLLVEHLKQFVRHECYILESPTIHVEETILQDNSPRVSTGSINHVNVTRSARSMNSSSHIISGPILGANEEVEFIQRALNDGVIYLLGETEVVADPNSSILKKIIVNYIYDFLRKNFRQGGKIMAIPHGKLLRVGMTYEI